MAIELLDNRYAPITFEIEFLECDARAAAGAFEEWQRPLLAARGMRLSRREVSGDFVTRILSLLPLTAVEEVRYLFLPTKSNWTAFLDNGWRGTDPSAVSYLATVIGCKGIRAASVPHEVRKIGEREVGQPGATMFELYAADSTACSFLNTRRSVAALYEDGWEFNAMGEPPLEFEQLQRYEAPRIRDRFTPDMLDDYLRYFGIRFFCPEFYEVPQAAILISKEGPMPPGTKKYSLEEARSG